MKQCDFFLCKMTYLFLYFQSYHVHFCVFKVILHKFYPFPSWQCLALIESITVVISTLRLCLPSCLIPLLFVLLSSLPALFRVNSLMTFMGPLFLIDAIFKDHIKSSHK